MAKFFFLSHLYFTTLPPIAPSMCLKRDVFRAFTSTLSDVKVAYLQMAQWGTWQLHLRQQLPHFAEFCNILLGLAVSHQLLLAAVEVVFCQWHTVCGACGPSMQCCGTDVSVL